MGVRDEATDGTKAIMAVHTYQPDVFFSAMGPYEPVLRIACGDTVTTTTVDNVGRDGAGRQVATGNNPQTGPFYVEDAAPGDMLAVQLDKLWPNSRMGRSATAVAPNTVDPWYVTQLPEQQFSGEWELDLENGTATLLAPETKLGRLALPFEPMLGCLGVAPANGQTIATDTSSTHGGNMDYKGFTSGVTAYFPVFEPGALLFMGDGHAVQGDGEIVGTGIEVSFDVQFTVRVLKGRQIDWPRGETDEHIFTVGNARPLDQALQHATTEMIRWLQQDFRLDTRGSHILLGQCAEYKVGNVFDPAYTMVCKVPRPVIDALLS